MAEAVRVKYGGKEYEFVRSEEVYEIVNGKKKRIRDNGNALLRLAGHTVKSRQDYRSSQRSFNAGGYWDEFMERNFYTLSNSPLPAATADTTRKPDQQSKKPELSDEAKRYIETQVEEQVRIRVKSLEDDKERLERRVMELEAQLKSKNTVETTKNTVTAEDAPLPNGDHIAYGTTVEEYENGTKAGEQAAGPQFPSEENPKSWKDRVRDFFYKPIVRTSTVWATRNINGEDVRERWTIESDEQEPRKAAMVLVGLGIAAVAGYIGYKLGQNIHDGSNIEKHQFGNGFDNNTINGLEDLFDMDIDGDGDIGLPDVDRNEAGGGTEALNNTKRHYWNEADPNSSVALELPEGYDIEIDAEGHHDIVDADGDVVGDDLEMTKSGAISQHSLDELEGLEKVGQTHLNYLDDTGPTENPNLPSAENPGRNTHTVTVLGRE